MRDILLFGGTAEGRELAAWLAAEGWQVTLSVATGYGAELAPHQPGITLSAGRLDRGEMEQLMASRPFACVVDATHPYAVEVTENIRAAAKATGLPLERLVRPADEAEDCLRAGSMDEAARMLADLPGKVLLTTGSKELAPFAVPGLAERCCPRVLPTLDSLGRCLELGFPARNIICMQGPFSQELNAALIRQLDIKVLVTKDTGEQGGFPEKAAAARETGCRLLVVDRPGAETGLELAALKERLREYQKEDGA